MMLHLRARADDDEEGELLLPPPPPMPLLPLLLDTLPSPSTVTLSPVASQVRTALVRTPKRRSMAEAKDLEEDAAAASAATASPSSAPTAAATALATPPAPPPSFRHSRSTKSSCDQHSSASCCAGTPPGPACAN